MLTITSSAAFAAPVAGASVTAGLIGALTGLGGGGILVPVLTLVFGVNLRYAVGASLISVIATTLGAIGGATLASRISTATIAIVFGIVLIYATVQSARPEPHLAPSPTPDRLGERLRLIGVEPTPAGPVPYSAHHVPAGLSLMAVAGAVSGAFVLGVLIVGLHG